MHFVLFLTKSWLNATTNKIQGESRFLLVPSRHQANFSSAILIKTEMPTKKHRLCKEMINEQNHIEWF